MKKTFIHSSILLFSCVILLSFGGCDIINGPKKCFECLSEGTGKKVLLEDWTGHRCGNCPQGHQAAKDLEDLYGDQLIVISIHASDFAKPKSPNYLPDYRTESGDQWMLDFEAQFPSACINRRQFAGSYVYGIADWGTYVAEIASETPALSIGLTASYDPISREVTIESDLEYFQTSSTDDHLVVVITEDSVMSTQTDYSASPEDIEDYAHRHMFRTCVTPGHYGVSLNGGTEISTGAIFNNTFTYTLDPGWEASKCHIVAYVMDGASKEIYQAEEIYVIGE